ncbi:hypothetical protein HJG60_010469 [Phyllostomus discolor]|uniref:Uncharacterized protein n=1 Tax=Phyllostomus discolor TaxID=89673 RepID=A0A834EB76_9CHIR|nr:hypothetical protein HJG60_010469 [Phyllostomus discolor]
MFVLSRKKYIVRNIAAILIPKLDCLVWFLIIAMKSTPCKHSASPFLTLFISIAKRIPQKVKYRTTVRSKDPTPRSRPTEWKRGTQTETGTPRFTAALFTTAKRWKQSKCPSTNEWIRNRGVYTQQITF